VSVCGTVVQRLKLRGFSWEPGITHFGPASRTFVVTPQLSHADLPTRHAYTLEPGRPTPGCANLLRPPIASLVGAGILTSFPSATTFVLTLGADSPCADERGAGNLGLSASRPFTCFIATHVSIRTSDTSSRVHTPPSQAYGTLSYHPSIPLNPLAAPRLVVADSTLGGAWDRAVARSSALRWNARIPSFGAQFEPRYIFRAGRLDQ
jgi:hypothetical protein